MDFENRALENLAHVDGGIDERCELTHDGQAGGWGAEHAGRRGCSVFPRGRLELGDGRLGDAPFLGGGLSARQPAARQRLEIARDVRQPLGSEAPGRPRERVRCPVQRLRVRDTEPRLERCERRPHRVDALGQPGRELRPHFSQGIGNRHEHSARTSRARSSGWNGLKTTPAAPLSASRRWSKSRRAVSSTIGTAPVAGSAFRRRHTS